MSTSERSFARRIDLTSLQLFVAVCELGSIGRAAEREFIAASAISKRLSDLEATLGTALLYRHARGVDLTPAGESLLHHARAMLYSLEKMQGELSEYADGVRGHVRVHANISAIVQFLPEDLGAFARAHEAIKIDLEEHLSSEVVRAVQEGAADLGICHVPADADALQTLPYRSDRLALVLPWATRWPRRRNWTSRPRWTSTTSACTPTARSTWPCTRRRWPRGAACGCASTSPGWTRCAG